MQMKFVVKKAWSSGGRVGALEIGSCPGSIETPALLLSTRKGLPHFISPDLLTSLPSPDSHLLQISPLHFLEGLASTTISKLGGLHQMLALHQYGIAAIARDSIQCLPESKGTTKLGASFETPCGRLLIKPKDYVEMISCMKPNIWVTLADEVPAWVSDKRNKTSVDRTVRWLDDCLKLNPAVGSIFGSIVGGPNLDERKRCAEEVAMRNVTGKILQTVRPHVFWTPCAAHCLDLMLEDIGKIPKVKRVIERGIKLVGYIYNHAFTLNTMRKYTNKIELVRHGVTRFATTYLTLQRLHKLKANLRRMFTSDEWLQSKGAKEVKGKKATEVVLMTSFWADVVYALKAMGPIVRVLRLVDNEKKPAMGYIYEAMERAKEAIQNSFNNNEDKYKDVFAIIDRRWDCQLHHPLHAAGYYLNPEFYYRNPTIMEADDEVVDGLFKCIEKLSENDDIVDKIHSQLGTYKRAGGRFGVPPAMRARTKMAPGFWIGGFGLGEDIDERPALLSAIIDVLPDEKPRMISGLGLPEEILAGIDAGIDLFDSTYIYALTLGGFGLTFSLDKSGNQYQYQKNQIGSDLTKINLRAKVYRKDMSPILGNCSCYTCKNHSKAYINHLFNVHEMLAQILLEIHNTHHYLTFFHVIREAIKDGRFEKFRQTFIESRRAHHEREALCA